MIHRVFTCMNFVTLEDELLGLVVCDKTFLFQFHYGDYQDILHLDYPRHPASIQLLNRHLSELPETHPLFHDMRQKLRPTTDSTQVT